MLLSLLLAATSCSDSTHRTVNDGRVAMAAATPDARASDAVNVRDFGALGVGGPNVHDFGALVLGAPNHEVAVPAAIKAAASRVFFHPRIYVINSPLQIDQPVSLTGSGAASVIRAIDCNGQWPHTGNNTYPLI